MRESQMKKIIAAAVATAFVAPAFAADVTVSGDVEFFYVDKTAAQEFDSGDQDVVISASEDLGNGTSVSVSLEMDGNEDGNQSDAVLTLANGPVTFTIGDAATAAINMFDEKSDVAEQGGTGGANDDSTMSGFSATHTAAVAIAPAEGLTLAASFSTKKAVAETAAVAYAAGATSQVVGVAAADHQEITSFAIQYSAMGLTVAYGGAEKEGDDDAAKSTSVSFASGPFYAGIERMSNYGFDGDKTVNNAGVSYDYGSGKIFFESGKMDTGTASTTKETDAVGASYKMGAVNMYVVSNQVTTGSTDDDQTIVGVEYAF
jgi:hypothetical protein